MKLPVRVKIRIKSLEGGLEEVAPALLNTGFTSDKLDILIPRGIAEKLGLWPPPKGSTIELLDTAGGEVIAYYVPNSVELTVIEEDKESKKLVCSTIISLHEKEILLSDAVIEALEIEILSPKTGLWRFKGERKIRRSMRIEG